MSILTEEEVYNGAKRWLKKNDFFVIAGQPARGVDHLPVVEIKMPSGEKGSRDAYKPDLVAYKNSFFYIIECKPEYNAGDYLKVNDVLSSEIRLKFFYTELQQYQLLNRVGYNGGFDEFKSSVKGVLAYSGDEGPSGTLNKLIVSSWKGQALWI